MFGKYDSQEMFSVTMRSQLRNDGKVKSMVGRELFSGYRVHLTFLGFVHDREAAPNIYIFFLPVLGHLFSVLWLFYR